MEEGKAIGEGRRRRGSRSSVAVLPAKIEGVGVDLRAAASCDPAKWPRRVRQLQAKLSSPRSSVNLLGRSAWRRELHPAPVYPSPLQPSAFAIKDVRSRCFE